MELRDFAAGIMYLNENGKKNQTEAASFLRRFFEKTAACTPTIHAVRKWITPSEKSKHNCDVKIYYPEPVLADNKKLELFMFIRSFGKNAALRCQKEFKRIISENNDKDCVIDTETECYDILCFSILNQFIILMGMDALRIDDPALNIDPEIIELVKVQQKQEDEKRKLATLNNAKRKVAEESAEIENERIALEEDVQKERERVAVEEKARKERERIEAEMIAHPQSTLAVPSEFNICRFCKYWQAKPDEGRKMGSPINGICTEYSFKSPATAEKCDRFVPHYGRIEFASLKKYIQNF